MKKVYRYEDNRAYWDRRWIEAGEDASEFVDIDIYPIKYANMVMNDKSARVLDMGCGLGRLVKHFHNLGYDIEGLERSPVAVKKINAQDKTLKVRQGDCLELPFPDDSFDVIMGFGLYHNLEQGLEEGLDEAARILKPGGCFVISMRPNNLEMRLNEWYWAWKNRGRRGKCRRFHKLLVGESEFRTLLEARSLRVDAIHYARNVSIFYRVPFLRDASLTAESELRSRGYRLNRVGQSLADFTTKIAPYHTANVFVYIGRHCA